MSAFASNLKKGFLWNLLSALGKQGTMFLAIIILARLLTPEDYGVMGMMAVFISVSQTVIDAGLGGALIKKKKVYPIDFSTLTSYNIVISLLLYLIMFIIAPFVADFYEKALLKNLLRVYSITIIIESLAIVPRVLLMKNLLFKQYAFANIISGLSGLFGAIFLAYLGFGVFSLICQYLITAIVFGAMAYYFTKYKIIIKFSWNSFKGLFSFGFNTTGANILKNFMENLYTNMIAKVAPLNITGFYNQSYKLQNVVGTIQNTIIDNTIFPILCKEKRDAIIIKARTVNNLIFFVVVNIYFLLMLNASEVIRILLGVKWIAMIPFFRYLLFAAIFQALASLNRNVLKSLGITYQILKIELVSFLISLPFLFFSIKIGYMYIIYCFIGYSALRMFFSIFFLAKKNIYSIKNQLLDFLKIISIPLIVYIISLLFIFDLNVFLSLFLKLVFYFFVLIVICEILKLSFYEKIKAILVKEVIKKNE